MNILGIDIGFGDTKVILTDINGTILKKFKFSSTIGVTKSNEYIKDPKIYNYKDKSYYVGNDALSLPSDNLIDIIEQTLDFNIPARVTTFHSLGYMYIREIFNNRKCP